MNAKKDEDKKSVTSEAEVTAGVTGPTDTPKKKVIVSPSDKSKVEVVQPDPPRKVVSATPPKAPSKKAQSAAKKVRVRNRRGTVLEATTTLVGDDGRFVTFGICAHQDLFISQELLDTPELRRLVAREDLQVLG